MHTPMIRRRLQQQFDIALQPPDGRTSHDTTDIPVECAKLAYNLVQSYCGETDKAMVYRTLRPGTPPRRTRLVLEPDVY